MTAALTRRELLVTGAALGVGVTTNMTAAGSAEAGPAPSPPFRYCLNTSTIRGQKLGLVAEVEIAAQAGYDAVEPWIREIDEYVQQGGVLKDLAKRITDLGLTVESAIGFAQWIVDDDAQRAAGLEEAKRSMDLVRQIGGTRIAAPPAGATQTAGLNLFHAAERYRKLLELGHSLGVVPQLEVWGFSKSLSRLGETALVAVESGHPDACLLPDVYHIYKGGSEFAGLQLFSGNAVHVFHVNDYPADPPRETIADKDRVYPGDGVAPLDAVLRTLRDNGFRGVLSLELFNPAYWQQQASVVAKTGLEKTKAAVKKALT